MSGVTTCCTPGSTTALKDCLRISSNSDPHRVHSSGETVAPSCGEYGDSMEKQCTTHSLRGWDPAPDVSAGCTYVKFPDALQREHFVPTAPKHQISGEACSEYAKPWECLPQTSGNNQKPCTALTSQGDRCKWLGRRTHHPATWPATSWRRLRGGLGDAFKRWVV